MIFCIEYNKYKNRARCKKERKGDKNMGKKCRFELHNICRHVLDVVEKIKIYELLPISTKRIMYVSSKRRIMYISLGALLAMAGLVVFSTCFLFYTKVLLLGLIRNGRTLDSVVENLWPGPRTNGLVCAR